VVVVVVDGRGAEDDQSTSAVVVSEGHGDEVSVLCDEEVCEDWERIGGDGAITSSCVGSGSGSTTGGWVVIDVVVVELAASEDDESVSQTVTVIGSGCPSFSSGVPSTGTTEMIVVGLCLV